MNTRHQASIIAHEAIGRALYLGLSEGPEIDSLVNHMVKGRDKAARGRAVKANIGTAIRAFVWHFDLRSTHEFMGTEMRHGSHVIDLVWRHKQDDTVLFDEIKTGVVQPHKNPAHNQQTDRYAVIGAETYGPLFTGVRCLPLLLHRRAGLKRSPGLVVDLPANLRGGSL